MKTTTSARIGNTQRNIGIDVGKSCLDCLILETDTYIQEPNTPEGIRHLLTRLARFKQKGTSTIRGQRMAFDPSRLVRRWCNGGLGHFSPTGISGRQT
ncbi:MAG: hypothetical protein RQ899_06745 [Pseudomonadales bacterium]|nr:hypothetical protein [Pseudomonadales bacterium]